MVWPGRVQDIWARCVSKFVVRVRVLASMLLAWAGGGPMMQLGVTGAAGRCRGGGAWDSAGHAREAGAMLPAGRARGGSARWRRSGTSFTDRLAAARVRAWSLWRGTTAQQQKGGPSGLGNFGSTTRPHGRGGASWRRGGWRAAAHTGNHGAHGSRRARRSQRARHDHGMHGAGTAHTPRSRRARIGHGTRSRHGVRSSTTVRASRTRHALR